MRAFVLAAIITSPLIAAPAFAQGSGFYVGGELGATIATETDQTYTPGTIAGTTGTLSTEHNIGLAYSGFAGYDFGMFRLEAEVGKIAADFDELTSSGLLLPGGTAAGTATANGEATAQLYMANAMVDFGGFYDFSFFAGGGMGQAKIEVSAMTAGTSPSIILDDEDDWRSAWQFFAGFRKPITSNIDVHVRYRYLDTDEAEFVGFGGRVVDLDMTTHTVSAGVSYRF